MSLNPVKSNFYRPFRAKDVTLLRLMLGGTIQDARNLLGSSNMTNPTGKNAETVLPPSMGILMRILMNNPEDNPMEVEPDFNDIRRMFAEQSNRDFGKRGKTEEGMARKNHMSVMLGMRAIAGNFWSQEEMKSRSSEPSPQVRKMFLLLDKWAEKMGAEKVWQRWIAAAEQEAIARGSSLKEIMENGAWPLTPEEQSRRKSKTGDTEEE